MQTFRENWAVYEEQWNRIGREIGAARGKVDGFQREELLATIGWILPEEMSFRELAHLVLECHDLTIQRVDDFFIDYYDRDGRVEFLNLKARLTSSSQLSNWRPLVEQTVSAFERGDYAICVPSLLLMIEGVIRVLWRVEVRKARDCAKFFERKIQITGPKTPDDCEAWVLQSRWRSIRAFVENVFGEASDREQYPMPKRHLILHGKSDPAQWDRADCLRLFQAISTIAWFGERLAEEVRG
jgi:uncharacterized protein YeeX (DUF496 family)